MTTTEADSASVPGSEASPGGAPAGTAPEPTDENVWLEDIYGEEQLAWVKEQNSRTEDLLEDADYAALEGSILEVLDSTDRIAMVGKRGDWYYNFWKDQQNPKGLWRRTTWESYCTDSPEWDVLLRGTWRCTTGLRTALDIARSEPLAGAVAALDVLLARVVVGKGNCTRLRPFRSAGGRGGCGGRWS